jgi:phosphoribosyl 1,2-cyclic phosphodiesterase
MSLFIASLNSGSNGNCYYIGNQEEAVLVDGGISCRETEKRMKRLGLSMKKVKAIFVTHEHGDHIHGVSVLARKHELPVYITSGTLGNCSLRIREDRILSFRAYEPVKIGSLSITGFPKLHDAADPHSFIVANDTVTVGIFTDIGSPCEHVLRHFEQCHAAFLEANYDEELLEKGGYPYHLKMRIRGSKGHLSNDQAAEIFVKHKPAYMSHLFLSHLSRDNNRPAIVQKLFNRIAGRTEIVIASRDRETQLYHIRNLPGGYEIPVRSFVLKQKLQLELFA